MRIFFKLIASNILIIAILKVFYMKRFPLVFMLIFFLFPHYSFADFASTKKLAAQGDAIAQYSLGFMYYDGQGVKQNYTQAFKWFEKAANQGYAAPQYNLGFMYGNGQGVKRSAGAAIVWYQSAANHGNTQAIKALERMGIRD